jgi:hypothetical protein
MHQAASGKRKTRSQPPTDPVAQVRMLLRDKPALAARRAAADRELRAAGIDPDAEPPADIDEFRGALARRINIVIGNRMRYWRDCKEPGCRRARSCLAPRVKCSNAPPLPPDPDGRRLARTLAQLQRTLRAVQDVGEGEQ